MRSVIAGLFLIIKGTFDYNKMKNILESANYQGVYMTEIYSLGFDVEKELRESKAYLETI